MRTALQRLGLVSLGGLLVLVASPASLPGDDTAAASADTVLASHKAPARSATTAQADDDDDDARPNRAAAPARAAARASGVTSTAPATPRPAASSSTAASSTASAAAAPAPVAAPAAPAPSVAPRQPVPVPPVAGARGALSWAPPAGYASFPVRKVTGVGVLNTVDGKGGDVLVQLPTKGAVGPITIKNCRNAVLIGGEIQVVAAVQLDGQDQRGIYVTGCTGTVHIEGVRINGDVAGSEADGIAVNAPKAMVQIENVRVDGMRGGKSGNHADVFQPWGGVREFRIDRLTGSTNYQGLHIGVDLGPIGGGTIRNTNIASTEGLPVDQGGQFLWLECNAYPLTLDNLYVQGRAGRSFGSSIWPQPNNSSCPSVVRSGVATWPSYSSLSGSVASGTPMTGDFVPSGSVGAGYVSPGYA